MIDAELLQEEQRKRLKQIWALTPEQRMERFQVLQASAWQTLASNTAARRAFEARNLHARRESRCQMLVKEMFHRNYDPA